MTPHTQIIHCARSGLPLAEIKILTAAAGWPVLASSQLQVMIHPAYALDKKSVLARLKFELHEAENIEWLIEDAHQTRLAVLMSAVMYSFDLMWIPHQESQAKNPPALPSEAVILGCAQRLVSLAEWLLYVDTRKINLPLYRTSVLNNNLAWENYHAYLNDCFEIRAAWASKKDQLAADEHKRLTEENIKGIKAESVYKRIDIRKVWNWIDIQLAGNKAYPAGRRETFKNLFLSGELSPEDWLADDVEDLQFAIADCCDIGNEITFFINKRLNNIKAVITDFYSSFTLLHSKGAGDALLDPTPAEAAAEGAFFQSFDARAATLQELPAAPERKDFASLGLFLKAQAQHAILARRFHSLQASSQASAADQL